MRFGRRNGGHLHRARTSGRGASAEAQDAVGRVEERVALLGELSGERLVTEWGKEWKVVVTFSLEAVSFVLVRQGPSLSRPFLVPRSARSERLSSAFTEYEHI